MTLGTLYILDAGEIYSITTSAQGINHFPRIIEFDDASPIKSAKLFSLVNGDNTLYNCPDNFSAHLLFGTPQIATQGLFSFSNNSGNTRIVIPYCTPPGSVVSTVLTRCAAGATVLDATVSQGAVTNTLPPRLFEDESIVINSDGIAATSLLWTNVFEKPL
mgnify:FL=1